MKKGNIEILALLVGLVVVFGGVAYTGLTVAELEQSKTGQVIKEVDVTEKTPLYVGDIDSKLVYDTTKCRVNIKNVFIFQSLEQAHKVGFKDAEGCV